MSELHSNEVLMNVPQQHRRSRSRSRSRSISPKSPALSESSYSSSPSPSRSRSGSFSPPTIQTSLKTQNNNNNNSNNNNISTTTNITNNTNNTNTINNNNNNSNNNQILNAPSSNILNNGKPMPLPTNLNNNSSSSSSSRNPLTAGTQSLKSSHRDRKKSSSSSNGNSSSSSSRSKSSIVNSLFRKGTSSSSSSSSTNKSDKDRHSGSGSGSGSRSTSSSSPSIKFKKSMSKKDKDSIMDLLAEDIGVDDFNFPIPPPSFSLQAQSIQPQSIQPQLLQQSQPQQQQTKLALLPSTTLNGSSSDKNGNDVEMKSIPPLTTAISDKDNELEITDDYYKKMLKEHSKHKSENRKHFENKLFENIILCSDSEDDFESNDPLIRKRNKLMDKYVCEMDENKREQVKCKIKKKKQESSLRDKYREGRQLTQIRRKLNEQLTVLNQSRRRRIRMESGGNVPSLTGDSLSGSDDELFTNYLQSHKPSSRSRSHRNSSSSNSNSKHSTSRNKYSTSSSSQIHNKIDLQAPPLSSDDEEDNEIDVMLQKMSRDKSRRNGRSSSNSGSSSSSSAVYEPKNLQVKYGCSEELDTNFQSKWFQIVKKEMPRAYRKIRDIRGRGLSNNKSIAHMMKSEIRKRIQNRQQLQKPVRDVQARSRRLVKEMGAYWRKYEKDEREAKKRAEKDAAIERKREEESREAKRQQKKLNFLISQTELYSHFMSKKLHSGSNGDAKQPDLPQMPTNENDNTISSSSSSGNNNKIDINDDSDDSDDSDNEKLTEQEKQEQEELNQQARLKAQKALEQQLSKTKAFDDDVKRIKMNNQREQGIKEEVQEEDDEDEEEVVEKMDLDGTLIPTNFPGEGSSLKQPTILNAQLKSYQLKGMSWIVNLYDQGINGILADEMGLGKTIQSIAVLANLAEEKGIWGPFLIVTPKSTLHNWYQEFKRFVPSFKVLPYWGSQKQRETLRKFWNVKKLYQKNSPFHVLVTSYNVIVLDEKYFHRVRWQYMVLDEAHSIKSSASNRWKTLMSFNCRNRLLLTGTPIQNNMAELWALLHFIMPTLFDSHDEFAEWFSKDIENHANTGGGGSLNEHQLNRLHLILKPFMLRRMKRDVENEMPSKHEIEVMCSLTIRQKKLYQNIRSKITIAELLGNTFSESSMKNLMNLVMQFRKVCNHPETFERSECKAPLLFQDPISKEPVDSTYQKCPNHLSVLSSFPNNPIVFHLPKLIYRSELWYDSPTTPIEFIKKDILKRFSIFNTSYICNSLDNNNNNTNNSIFNFIKFVNISPNELSNYFLKYSIVDQFIEYQSNRLDNFDTISYRFSEYPHLSNNIKYMLLEPTITSIQEKLGDGKHSLDMKILSGTLVSTPFDKYQKSISIIQSTYSICPKATTPPVEFLICDQSFKRDESKYSNLVSLGKLLLNGQRDQLNQISQTRYPDNTSSQYIEDLEINGGLMGGLYNVFGSSQIWVPSFSKSLNDSGKLQVLDKLLKQLKVQGHRVLIYSQFTKMINILEDFMIFRKYKFLRLDGSYKLEDRRDMVDDFQNDNSIFAFLLSTRACGIGINLTAADTVIFYDSDWNPTVDEQAMDRCHRLGQVRPVTVYRLITKGTIEERIIKRAKQKHHIQSIVIAGGKFENNVSDASGTDENSTENMKEVVSFLLEDDEVEEKLKQYQQMNNNNSNNNGRKRKLGSDNTTQDKPFNPSDIPASKLMKGRPPKDKSLDGSISLNSSMTGIQTNPLSNSTNNININSSSNSITTQPTTLSGKPPPKKKGPKPGSKRNKTTDSSNVLINPQTGETTLQAPVTTMDINGNIITIPPPQPPPSKGKKKGAPKAPTGKPRGRRPNNPSPPIQQSINQ